MRTKNLLIFLIISTSCFSQTKKIEGFGFEIKKVKIVPFNPQSDPLHIIYDTKKEKEIMVKLKVRSLSNKRFFDPNKFYFINEKNKIRFRPTGIRRNAGKGSMVSFRVLTHQNTEKTPHYIKYEPKIKDSFYNFKKEGYKDIEIEFVFGFIAKGGKSTIYFKPEKIKSKTIDVLTIVPKNLSDFKIYYGNIEILEFKVE